MGQKIFPALWLLTAICVPVKVARFIIGFTSDAVLEMQHAKRERLVHNVAPENEDYVLLDCGKQGFIALVTERGKGY